eukprot:749091-Hanusia_phi.AAC.1
MPDGVRRGEEQGREGSREEKSGGGGREVERGEKGIGEGSVGEQEERSGGERGRRGGIVR